MIKIENTEVFGWEAAVRGMRNPKNSWEKSDTLFGDVFFTLGENDLKLMQNLSNAGNDHGKFLRMITVTCDITAPLYWWKEFDTYKVGTVANSCSTMHKLMAKEFEESDFSFEHLRKLCRQDVIGELLSDYNDLRDAYLNFDTDEEIRRNCEKEGLSKKDIWYGLIQLLPSSYNQKRTVQINYQVAKAQRAGRRHHKLDEWHDYCDWLEGLPYFKEICLGEGHK